MLRTGPAGEPGAITSGGDPTTNYQLMPGDRLIVYRDPIVGFTVFLDRLIAPIQSVLGTTLQTAFTIRAVKFAGLSAGAGAEAVRRLPLGDRSRTCR